MPTFGSLLVEPSLGVTLARPHVQVPMVARVGSRCSQLQIRECVVTTVVVSVMHDFPRYQPSPQVQFHDPDMLKHVTPPAGPGMVGGVSADIPVRINHIATFPGGVGITRVSTQAGFTDRDTTFTTVAQQGGRWNPETRLSLPNRERTSSIGTERTFKRISGPFGWTTRRFLHTQLYREQSSKRKGVMPYARDADLRVVILRHLTGGLDLGLERAGFKIAFQVENDPHCCRVLAKHWPNVPRWGDIREVNPDDLPRVDLLAGGFPCQPVSVAGKRRGQDDDRWLWPEFARLIRALRPDYVLVENVPGLLHRGFGDVLGDLAACGYDAEWDCLPAAAVGAPHRRDRVWMVAYPDSAGLAQRQEPLVLVQQPTPERGGWWATEPALDRVDDGTAHRVDRLRGLGNAVVPQCAEWIGRRLLEHAHTGTRTRCAGPGA